MIVVLIRKRMEILTGVKIISFHGLTLITRKIGERKALLANPKLLYHVSQCREHDCSANNKMNGDYYEYLCFSHFMDKL